MGDAQPDPQSVLMCMVCKSPVLRKDFFNPGSPCRRAGHMFSEWAPKNRIAQENITLYKRAREKWHEWKKDKSRNLGIGF